ncbi:bifunctional 3,4-dihydroxy-2-butanone-4-phosphate synthase/GTP cyclohydrolase II [Actinomyces sp. 594]|nr:bifunctional 3,4-dihydroxy-2-butanone-4-phosphate synthase/GTP cyclohydrolase II [Actinomyces sp. 594]MBW3070121.1 bifunctional 3,4-dihydroxy-2-butanone-4-phosphate synthase/GTP cyclohydrolase II [Actinomyces sp. 594]
MPSSCPPTAQRGPAGTQPGHRPGGHDGTRLDTVEQALDALRQGRMVIVVDDEGRENEGDLVFAADTATPQQLAFAIRHSTGIICVPTTAGELDRLDIPMMTEHNTDPKRTAFTLSADASLGITTGVSADDRARTIRVIADPGSAPADLVHPGHVFPLRAREGGILARRGHTEAAVDLMRLSGHRPVGVLVEIVNDDGTMARRHQLREFADAHSLPMISVEDLERFRWLHEELVEKVVTAHLPTAHGEFTAHALRSRVDGAEYLALVCGSIADGEDVLTRVHSACLTGDVLSSLRCDCGPQLRAAMEEISARGRGVLVYASDHEGRGIGLIDKLRAYALQEAGMDTLDANVALGLPVDARSYATAAQVLRFLGVRSVELMTNNPDKVTGLERYGVRVSARRATPTFTNGENLAYLRTKRDRMGHLLAGPELGDASPAVVPQSADPAASVRPAHTSTRAEGAAR